MIASVYIAGPMRGIPFFNFPAFNLYARSLRAEGIEVWNPADHDREMGLDPLNYPNGDLNEGPYFDLSGALKWDCDVIANKVDAVVALPGWHESPGVAIERACAAKHGVPFYEVENMHISDDGDIEWGPEVPRLFHKIPDPVRMKDPTTGAEKEMKLERYDLIPVGPLRRLALHYGLGAQKYADRNWEGGYPWSWSYRALQNHANEFWGKLGDEGSAHHLAAIAFHAFALLEFLETYPQGDDRPPT